MDIDDFAAITAAGGLVMAGISHVATSTLPLGLRCCMDSGCCSSHSAAIRSRNGRLARNGAHCTRSVSRGGCRRCCIEPELSLEVITAAEVADHRARTCSGRGLLVATCCNVGHTRHVVRKPLRWRQRCGGQLCDSPWQCLHHAYNASYITMPCLSISWSSAKSCDSSSDSA